MIHGNAFVRTKRLTAEASDWTTYFVKMVMIIRANLEKIANRGRLVRLVALGT